VGEHYYTEEFYTVGPQVSAAAASDLAKLSLKGILMALPMVARNAVSRRIWRMVGDERKPASCEGLVL
jgi:hypothetical protein